MKKYFLLLMSLITVISVSAQGRGQVLIHGVMCPYDTIESVPIGPGAVYTQIEVFNIEKKANMTKTKMHILTVDLTNPYNSLAPWLAQDKFFASTNFKAIPQVNQYNYEKKQNRKPIASVTTSAFNQTTYEVSGSLVRNNKVLYEQSKSLLNCYIDAQRQMHVGYTQLNGVAKYGDIESSITAVNHSGSTAVSNSLSMFCNGIQKSWDTNSSAVDVVIKPIAEDDAFRTGVTHQCEVVEVKQGRGNTIPEGCAILSAVNGYNNQFVSSVKSGDIISVTLGYKDSSGQPVEVEQQFTNFKGYAIKDGVALEDESVWRSDAIYPIPCIGTSKDCKTAYLSLVESSIKYKAPYVCLAEVLQTLGCYNAIWMDGGPSAEMQIEGTVKSYEYKRNVPSALALYSTAPNDDNASVESEIAVVDPSTKLLNVGGSFSISVNSYNSYGERISKDIQNAGKLEVEVVGNIGTYSNGIFTATKTGHGLLRITHKSTNKRKTIPIVVAEPADINFDGIINNDDVQMLCKYIFGKDMRTVFENNCDFNKDNQLTVTDVTLMVKQMKN